MPIGDVAGGRGYLEPKNEPAKDGRVFDVPMGDNPYFPQEQPDSSEEIAAPDQEPSADGQDEVVEEAEGTPEPTFDTETDRQAGIDVDDPNYKHFQAAFTRARQKDSKVKSSLETQFEQMQAKLAQFEARAAKAKLEEPEPASAEEPTVKLSFEGFVVPRLPEDSQLAGYEEEIASVFKPMAQHVINEVARQQRAMYQQMQTEQTKQKITQFVSGLETKSPEKVSEALGLLEEYAEVAKTNPDKWIKFAEHSLGLNIPPPEPTAEPDAKRLVQKQQNASSRPTSSRAFVPTQRRPTSIREAVEMSVDAVLG